MFFTMQIISVNGIAQDTICNYSLKGVIFDLTTKEPLPGATIQIDNSDIGTTSDIDGKFELSGLCQKEFDLEIRFLGFNTVRHHHDYHHDDLQVYLSPLSELLDAIIVEGERHPGGLNSMVISALNAEEIKLLKLESLGDALSTIEGVSSVKSGVRSLSVLLTEISLFIILY